MLKNDEISCIHYPNNPNKFEFDEEVATIFDDMALRSIPIYEESRRLSVMITLRHLADKITRGESVTLMDVGASTGAFYKDIWKALGYEYNQCIPGVHAVALDNSKHMMEKLLKHLPEVHAYWADATTVNLQAVKFDAVYMAYVLQFVEPRLKQEVLDRIYDSLKPGGIFIISNKEFIINDDFYQNEYINFRLANGYSVSEIEAKTKALAGSMTPVSDVKLRSMLENSGFEGLHGVSRWLQFSTYKMYKPE